MPDKDTVFRGNPHHLAVLEEALKKSDMALWNAYVRKSGSSFRARLAGADLSKRNLNEAKLAGADLCDADLSGSTLLRCDLSKARLRGANLENSNLTGARLIHGDFTKAVFRHADLSHVKARGAVFVDADLTHARFDTAELSEAKLNGAAVSGSVRGGNKMKVRVKAQKDGEENRVPRGKLSPWLMAQEEEEERKALRRIREGELAEKEKENLNRKLGRKRPLFNRVK